MSENNRDSNRIGIVIEIKMICDDDTTHVLNSQNISDSGVFLDYGDTVLDLDIGTHVVLQVCSQLGEGAPPPVNAEIARITNEGVGLKFIL